MVIDTSALVAILNDEPERAGLAEAIERDPVRLVSAVSLFEASIVVQARYGEDGVDDLDLLLAKIDAEVVAFLPEDVPLARQAYRDYGKGRDRAGLNFGDCFAYALSVKTGEPLLYKGDDFAHTDVASATVAAATED
ncbi:type II toxin-antitoxin system VapC family toxin [bacterium]|nr:MAG: type II toxin-antitoxin system VapC family toxin [bacterium]